jgi:2-polyprenyl-3-methyl-5-hydroxy-6-metoxy-1,4-benzoquinol methylase
MPLEEDIHLAYGQYYTHGGEQSEDSPRARIKTVRPYRRYYWALKYGYPVESWSLMQKLWGRLMYLRPSGRVRADMQVRFLAARPGGRLLDVGCGSGGWLRFMKSLGWNVEGVDFDPVAVAAASKQGLTVHSGSLPDQAFEPASFDAVTLSHVIEHVHDPLALLTECNRILKPDGNLVLLTPNNQSLGHRLFKRNWRGLEPPRHIHVLNAPTIQSLMEQAGFESVLVRTGISSKNIFVRSLLLRSGLEGNVHDAKAGRFTKLLARTLVFVEEVFFSRKSRLGELVIAVGKASARSD